MAAREARRLLSDGDAIPVFAHTKRGAEKIIIAVQRAMGRPLVLSAAAITVFAPVRGGRAKLSEVEQSLAGSRQARAKLRWWPQVGQPALRHAQ